MSEVGGNGNDPIAELAERLRARQALGRSEGLNRLFDYLVESALAGTRPKEFEVAVAVFGRGASFDGSQDASVRVAVHRLRRKLDEFYSGPGADEPVRLAIPKGEYRMVAEPRPAEPAVAAAARPWRRYAAAGIALLLALNLIAWAAFWTTHGADRAVARAQASAPWAGLLKAEPPTLLVLGDYYIFGEIDETAGVNRLVREYGINSREDLDAWLMDNPKAMGSYRDLDLYYLPVGAAFALRSIVPVLTRGAAHGEALHVVMASDLTPEMLKRNNIVYLGYLSGLGVLRAPVFAASRFSIGETYDELIDGMTHKSYLSQEGGPSQGGATRRDYGYVTAFKGPAGNRIVVIAGDRDTGLMQAAEALANPDALKALARAAGSADGFEALYEAQGIGRASLGGRLILASPRRRVNPWTSQTDQSFPVG
ncbi:MAG: helix-turn-helix protein [Phenylobacterium sp.]|nr:helix-turn-helix protein [Phenylobacterium sp.]